MLDVTAKKRYNSSDVAATKFPRNDTIELYCKRPQRAVAPGQSVVFYRNDEVLGGGIIES